ncbi:MULTISPECIES: hypothetical protein [Microvirga]|uniref:hypothetical protein n=1 Tax=Microvirga TaxID=186650 RepID=UPI001CFFD306|nr:hypothetical protein [Microvirga lenta]MCB5176165.1 hypothetical protein [Microvirga lenta]
MGDRDDEPDAELDDFDKAARVNFRDYPSSAVVVLAALGSGLAWLMYKWRGKKSAARRAPPAGVSEAGNTGPKEKSSPDGNA